MGSEFTHRAFAAFTVALAASIAALFSEIGYPYLPSIPIVVYGIYLLGNRDIVAVSASDSLRDSPYFLGFLLTMVGLFKLFNDVSFNFALFGRNPALLTQEVGGAVLSTIVGLFVRQALLLLVPDLPPKEDDRLAQLSAAITSHAVAFELARQDFFRELSAEADTRAARLDALERRISGTAPRRDDDLPPSGATRQAPPDAPVPAPSAPASVVPRADAPVLSTTPSAPPQQATPTPPSSVLRRRLATDDDARALDDAWQDVEDGAPTLRPSARR